MSGESNPDSGATLKEDVIQRPAPQHTGSSSSSSGSEGTTTAPGHTPGRIIQKSVFSQPRLKLFSSLTDGLHVQKSVPILQYYDVTVYRNDLDNLKDNEWLNDNNITFLYEYLERTVLTEYSANETIVLLRPSMSYLLLHFDGDASSLKEVLPPLKSSRFIFLPINDNPDVSAIEGGFHWSLLVVSLLDRKALYYDTMRGTNYGAAVRTTKKLAQFFGFGFELICVETPQQRNNSDCGVYVCELTELLVKRLVMAGADHDINLGLRDVQLSANRGRSYLLKIILRLIAERDEEKGGGNGGGNSLKKFVQRVVDHRHDERGMLGELFCLVDY